MAAIYIHASNLSQLKYQKLDLKIRIVNNLKIGIMMKSICEILESSIEKQIFHETAN